jgi:hypothetical protein
MCVVVLITQRSQVQILPPLPSTEAGSGQGTGLLLAVCAWALFAACLADSVVVVRLVLDTAHQQSADDQVGERVRDLAVGFELSRWPSAASGNVCVLWVASLAARSE